MYDLGPDYLARAIFTEREDARAKLTEKIADQTRLRDAIEAESHLLPQLRRTFTTIDPNYLIADAEWRLRWIDCAPEGANHIVAPMQDKNGVPMGGVYDENVGPCQALRDARSARGLNPFSGLREL
jgi:hypothetical protein